MDASNYLGRGLNFPLKVENGTVELTSYEELIANSIKTILSWPIHQRYFEPPFGSRLYQLVGEPNDRVLNLLVKKFIKEALSSNEQRINVLEVSVTSPQAQNMLIDIKYQIKGIPQLKELEYKFYTGKQ